MAGPPPLYRVLIFRESRFADTADERLELYEAAEMVWQFNRLTAGGPHWAAITEQEVVIEGEEERLANETPMHRRKDF